MSEVETKKYTITGLVDTFDEQGNITGQFAVGSVQELPVEFGDAAVADGRAELFEGEEAEVAGDDTTTAPAGDDSDSDEDEDESDEDEEESEDDTTA